MPLWFWYLLCLGVAGSICASNLWPRQMRVRRRPRPVSYPVQIVCGNCAGDKIWPHVTHLAPDGTCATCGGTSYAYRERFGRAVAVEDTPDLRYDLIEGRQLTSD